MIKILLNILSCEKQNKGVVVIMTKKSRIECKEKNCIDWEVGEKYMKNIWYSSLNTHFSLKMSVRMYWNKR